MPSVCLQTAEMVETGALADGAHTMVERQRAITHTHTSTRWLLCWEGRDSTRLKSSGWIPLRRMAGRSDRDLRAENSPPQKERGQELQAEGTASTKAWRQERLDALAFEKEPLCWVLAGGGRTRLAKAAGILFQGSGWLANFVCKGVILNIQPLSHFFLKLLFKKYKTILRSHGPQIAGPCSKAMGSP